MQPNKKSRVIIPLYLKIAVPFAFYFIVFISFISFFSIRGAVTQTKNEIAEISKEDVKRKIAFTEVKTGIIHKDVHFLVNMQEIQNYLNAVSFDEKIKTFNGLKQEFFHFSHTRQDDYNQIRLFNSKGVEIIKIKNSDHATALAEESELRNESEKYYVKDALAIQPNELYISRLDLSTVDGSEIEYPLNPTFRIAVKVFDKNQKNFAILMLDFKAETVVSEAGEASEKEKKLEEGHYDLLLNGDGYYLSHKDKEKEFGMLLGNENANIKKDDPWLASAVLTQEKGHITHKETNDLVYFESKPLKEFLGFGHEYDPDEYKIVGSDEKIIFAEITKSSTIFSVVKPLRNDIFREGALTFVIGAILIFIIATLITKPLKKLTAASEKLAKGEWDIDLKVETADELETLCSAFENMASNLKDLYQNLENKVAERTLELNLERDKLKKIIDTLPVGVMIASAPSGKIVLANSKGLELFGKFEKAPTAEQFVKMYNLTKPDGTPYPDSELPLYTSLKHGKASIKDDVVVKKETDRNISLLMSSIPIFNDKGTVTEAVVVFDDITKLKDIDRLKTEFISIASHQLKTPIGSLGWLSEMLLAGDAGKLSTKQSSMVYEIYTTSQRMSRLVEDLLNVSRLEMGRIIPEIKETDISSMLKEIKQELSPSYTPKKQKIDIKVEKDVPKLNTDPKLLHEILENLFSNAVKYTPEAGSVSISVKKDKNNLLFTVKDSGIGIPKSEQNKIFNKFFRAENAKETHVEGTGLGLYVVKSMIEVLGGKIWFESEENKGTTFYFTLPIK